MTGSWGKHDRLKTTVKEKAPQKPFAAFIGDPVFLCMAVPFLPAWHSGAIFVIISKEKRLLDEIYPER